MKKQLTLALASLMVFFGAQSASAQLQKGNVLIGASSNLAGLGFGFGNASNISIGISPKIGYFIQNNIAIGGLLDAQWSKTKGFDGIFSYRINAFGRYYIPKGEIYNPLNDGRFFLEGQAGLGGQTGTEVGFNLAVGVGYAYFITPNIALETTAMLHSLFGTGSSTGLAFNLGFSMHLPTSKLKEELRKVEDDMK